MFKSFVAPTFSFQLKVLFGVDPLYKGAIEKNGDRDPLNIRFNAFWLYLSFLLVPVHPNIGQTLAAT